MKISIRAEAKVNLFLEILEKRQDNYHNLETIMQTVSLYDIITVQKNEHSQKIQLTGDLFYTKTPEENTVSQAARAFFEYTDIDRVGLEVTVEKNIPVSAGLAGGSTDAAATLAALNKLFKARLTLKELCNIGKKIGADVPFCLLGGTALAQGTGTSLVSLPAMPKCFFVLTKPEFSISTQKAYALYDRHIRTAPKANVQQMIHAIHSSNIQTISTNLFNHFDEILSIPQIKDLKNQFYSLGAIGACMSGSGPTVFGIFKEETLAAKCLKALRKQYPQTYLCEPTYCSK